MKQVINTLKSAHDEYRRLNNDNQYFECQLEIIAETEKAICFNNYRGYLPKKQGVWIPKSQMQFIEHKDFGRRVFIKNWLLSKLD